MTRLSASALASALGLAAAIGLASCGGGESADLLPGSTASQINANLSQVERLAGEGECVGAQDAAAQVSEQVEALTGIDAELKQALSEGAAKLNEVVVSCEEATPEEPVETLETVEEPETDEQKEKPEKPEKPEKDEEKAEEAEEEPAEGPAAAPENHGKGKGEEDGGGTPSGGVGPGAPTGEG